jgi:hypothetical protein
MPAVLDNGRGLLMSPWYPDVIRATFGLVGYWRLADSSGTVMRDELALVSGSYGGTPTLAVGTPIPDSRGFQTNGTTQFGTIVKSLATFSAISLSFWMWWDVFANNDKLAFEYGGTNYLGNGFIVDPNATNGSTNRFNFGIGIPSGSASWLDEFARPSGAAWHHYLLTMDRATPAMLAYVDGVPQTMFTTVHNAGTYGNFSNSTLRLMCRNGGSLFGAGRMSELAIYSRLLIENDGRTHYLAGVS